MNYHVQKYEKTDWQKMSEMEGCNILNMGMLTEIVLVRWPKTYLGVARRLFLKH